MTRLFDPLLSLLYPMACGACGLSVESHQLGVACHACWTATRVFNGSESLCVKCGVFLGDGNGRGAQCGRCLDHDYDAAVAVGIYESALSASVLQLKRSPRVAPFLRRLISSRLQTSPITADVIIPTPLSPKRRVERGFNQAEIIAEVIVKTIKAELRNDILRRKRHADRNRALMDRKGRELTVRNAFEVTVREHVRGRSILIIDDVLTSGATASACAKVLKKNGAATVTVFTLARAV